MNNELKTGTTTLGIVAKDAVVLAADKRATAGVFIASKAVKKVLRITDNLGLTTAGSVSDLQLLVKYLRSELGLNEIRTSRKPRVGEAANLLSVWVYSMVRRYVPGVVHFVLGGYDDKPLLFDVFPDGSLTEIEDFVASGSGSLFAYGVLESQYKRGLSVNEAVNLARVAVNTALQRDAASGGGLTVAVIDKNGFREVVDEVVSVKV